MSLRWRAFERSIKPRVRHEVRNDTALRDEYRRTHLMSAFARVARWFNGFALALLFAVSGIVAVVVPILQAAFVHEDRGIDQLLVFFTALAVVFSVVLALIQLQRLRGSWHLAVFAYQPRSDGDFYLSMWRRVRWGALVCWYFFALGYGVIAWKHALPASDWLLAMLVAGMEALVTLSLAAPLVALSPRIPNRSAWMGMLLYWCVILFATLPAMAPRIPPLLADAIYCLPPGWCHGILRHAIVAGKPAWWWLLVPVALSIACLRPATAWLARNYQIHELSSRGVKGMEAVIPSGVAKTVKTPAPVDVPESFSAIVGSKQPAPVRPGFVCASDWKKLGPVERLAGRMLSKHERAITECILAGPPRWTRNWLMLALVAAVVALAATALGNLALPPKVPELLYGLLAALVGLAGLFARWPAFSVQSIVGQAVPAFAYLPFDFRELMTVIYKLAFVRCLCLVPIALLLAAAAPSVGFDSLDAVAMGLKALFVFIVVQPLLAHLVATNVVKPQGIGALLSRPPRTSSADTLAAILVVGFTAALPIPMAIFLFIPHAAISAICAGFLAGLSAAMALAFCDLHDHYSDYLAERSD